MTTISSDGLKLLSGEAMTTADALALPFMTVDDFLAWDGDGYQGKLELVDGIVESGGAVKLASIDAAFAIDDIYAETHLLGAQT